MNRKLMCVFDHIVPAVATISMIATNHHALACLYFSGYSLAWFFWVRKERERKQYVDELLDIAMRVQTCSWDELERLQIGIMSTVELQSALSRLTNTPIGTPTLSKKCVNCKFYHGKNGIVCAVHPGGTESDSCADFDRKP